MVAVAEQHKEEYRNRNAMYCAPMHMLSEILLINADRRKPKTWSDMPRTTQQRMEKRLNGTLPAHSVSRVAFARSLGWLRRLNPQIAATSIFTKLKWGESKETPFLWQGFPGTRSVSIETWCAIQPFIWDVFPNSAALDQSEDDLYKLLGFALLNDDFKVSHAEARRALKSGTSKGRTAITAYWRQWVDSATEFGAIFFRDRLRPILADVWPADLRFREKHSSENLALLAIHCGSEICFIAPF
jgi:hypothetical protein